MTPHRSPLPASLARRCASLAHRCASLRSCSLFWRPRLSLRKHRSTRRSSTRSAPPVNRLRWCFTPIGAPLAAPRRRSCKQLMQTPEFKDVTLFVADFDTEKALKRSLGVTQQSTVVVFKGGKETARSTGDTGQTALAALLRRAVT